MRTRTFQTAIGITLGILTLQPAAMPAQTSEEAPETQLPEIADVPLTVDPAKLVPEKLAAAATVAFDEASLRDIAAWIQEDRKIPVLFDNAALGEARVPLGEPVTDRLSNEPLYLLLNRLRTLGLGWQLQDDILTITTSDVVKNRMSTRPYSAGDLLDAGYDPDHLSETIRSAIDGHWMDHVGHGGSLEWLGDVLFVRQSDPMHRQIEGLFVALRKHGRRTFTYDPPQHAALREKLAGNFDVAFVDTPLARAVEQLAEQTGVDMRIDVPALRDSRIRTREPVSLTLTGRSLRTILRVLLADLELTWILRDGVLWITNNETAGESLMTAVYDVRDLCRDSNESDELLHAIFSQTEGPWEADVGEGGSITFALPGTMVVRQRETELEKILDLLESYRTALRDSKRRDRDRDAVDPQEVITRYYLLHERIAVDLSNSLPLLVQPDTWRVTNADAPGSIYHVSSTPELLDAQGHTVRADGDGSGDALVIPRTTLIVRNRRSVHEEIAEVITRIQNGDPLETQESAGGGFGGGGGGGGFGGRFFSVR